MSNPFIVLEAIDAGGSQSQTDLLVKKLKQKKYRPLKLHFPQEDRATGQLIYKKFLWNNNRYQLSRREQSLLYIEDFFSRIEDMQHVISSQNKKNLLVSDRFVTSTMVYQTIGLSSQRRQRILAWIEQLCWKGQPALPKPNLVILLDTPAHISLGHLRGRKKDYFESRRKLMMLRRSYVRLAREQGWIIIKSVNQSGTQRSKQDIHAEVWDHVQKLLS